MADTVTKMQCLQCSKNYEGLAWGSRCPDDGAVLVAQRAARQASGDPSLGRVVGGKYAMVDILGRGGFGAVYRAIQEPVGRAVAIKMIRPMPNQHSDVQGRFFREARVVAQLNDPTIVTLFDYGEEEDGALYMACELVDGMSLAEATKAGPMDPHRAASIMVQSLRALAVAHRAGLIHRDVKPGNIMIQADAFGQEQVKVLDFGIAKVLDLPEDEALSVETREGVVLGTPRYMAPEQARNHEIDARTDIYSLAVVGYEMLAGKPPFTGDSAVEVLIKHISNPAPPMAPALRVPKGLQEVIFRALNKDPAERYQTATEMAEALNGAFPDIPLGSAMYSGSGTLSRMESALVEAFAPTRVSEEVGGTSREMLGEVVDDALAETGAPPTPAPEDLQPKRSKAPLIAAAVVLIAAAGWFFTRSDGVAPPSAADAGVTVRAAAPDAAPPPKDAAPPPPDAAPKPQDAAPQPKDVAQPDAAVAAKKPKPPKVRPKVQTPKPKTTKPKQTPSGLEVPEF